jgi:hypothetical protein
MTHDEFAALRLLSGTQVEQFTRDGFVRIDEAFPGWVAEEASKHHVVAPPL